MTRMQAVIHFFNLKTPEEKKEYMKLTPEDRQEIAAELKEKHGYVIDDLAV